MRRSKGFSLVELMIVVAILGLLAAIAVTQFTKFQLRAKRAELPGNVDGLKISQISFEAANDYLVNCPIMPRDHGSLDKQAVPWNTGGDDNWRDLGWAPDGDVRGAYTTNESSDPNKRFTVFAYADMDGDDIEAIYEADQYTNATMTTENDTF